MKICSAPWFNLTIHSSGKAVMCCIDYKLEYIVGDTNEQTLEEILYGEILERVRQQHSSGSLNFSPCNKCINKHYYMDRDEILDRWNKSNEIYKRKI